MNDFYGTLCSFGLGFASTSSGRVIGCWLGYHLSYAYFLFNIYVILYLNEPSNNIKNWMERKISKSIFLHQSECP